MATAATGLAWILSLPWLNSKALWIDEADSFFFAQQPVRTILFGLCDPHPPAYYLLLKAMIALGHSEFHLRFPSAVAATLAVPLLYAAARRLAKLLKATQPIRVAVLSAFLLASAPLHIWYAQEARMYALVLTLGLVSFVLTLQLLAAPSTKTVVGYVIAATIALLIDQSSILPLLLANLVWLWIETDRPSFPRRELAIWITLQVIAGSIFLVWWSHALYPSMSDGGRLYQLTMIMHVLQRLGLPVSLSAVQSLFLTAGITIGLTFGILFWRAMQRRARLKSSQALAIAILVAFALVTMGAAVPRLFTVKRLLLGLLPGLVFASAWSLRQLRGRNWQLALVIITCVGLSVMNSVLVPKGPWRTITTWLETQVAPDDVIWVDALAVPALTYYYKGDEEIQVLHATDLEALETEWTLQQSSGAGRLWLVILTDPYRNLLNYLSQDATQTAIVTAKWPGVTIQAYDTTLLAATAPLVTEDPPAWLLTWPSPLDPACQIKDNNTH